MLMVPKILRSTISSSLIAGLAMVPPHLARRLLSFLRQNPRLTDNWGFHVRPINFYEPLPDFGAMRAEQLRARRNSRALDWRAAAQARLIEQLAAHAEEAKMLADSGRFDFANSWFGNLDAAVYYCLLRLLRPRRKRDE